MGAIIQEGLSLIFVEVIVRTGRIVKHRKFYQKVVFTMGLETIYLTIAIGLIILFVVSFTLFIRKMLINSSLRNSGSNEIEKKLDMIIEQNNKLISLLEKKG
jgi:hypothetical protein